MLKKSILLSPLNYLRIKDSDSCILLKINSIYPLILTALLSIYILYYPNEEIAFCSLLESVLTFLQFIIGFYIASLSAVATFQNENLDSVPLGSQLTLK